MNSETQKQFVLKLIAVMGLACMSWLFFVEPAYGVVNDQKEMIEIHQQQIDNYKMNYGEIDSGTTAEMQRQLDDVYQTMSLVLVHREAGTSLHGVINETASQYGISMTRIESGNAMSVNCRVGDSEMNIRGTHYVVRIDFEGDYSSVVAFMDALVTSEFSVNVSSFRLIPSGHETVRAMADVSSVMLDSIPVGTDEGGGDQ